MLVAYQFQTPTKIISGIGSTAEIIKELNDLYAKKVAPGGDLFT